MQAYMKSAMPYLGVTTPQLRAVCRAVFAAHPLATGDEWRAAIHVVSAGKLKDFL
jgi:DNA alkylation repair enzyme